VGSPKTITINGKRFRWVEVDKPLACGDRGMCSHPNKPGRTIWIRSDLEGLERLEVAIHEMLHAAMWHVDEEYIDEWGADIARALWRLGVRWNDE